jgi:PBSX family phage terminase large subunit
MNDKPVKIPDRFKARPKQLKILSKLLCRDLIEAKQHPIYGGFFGGIGSGKTATGTHFSITMIKNNPATVGFIGANSYQQLNQSTLKNFFEYVDKYGFRYVYDIRPPRSWGIKSKFKKHNGIITFAFGPQIIVRSMENYDDIRGIEIGWLWLDETRDTKKEAWDVVKGRLRDNASTNRAGLITTTPNGHDWQHEEFIVKPGTKNDEGKILNKDHIHVISSTYENRKNLPEGYIESLEDSYDSFLAKQELGGEFVNTQSGRVYYSYTDLNHDKTIKYDPSLALYIGMDFNVDPMTAVLYQNYTEQDATLKNHIISKIFKVYYLRGSNTQLLAKKIVNDFPNAPAYILTPCQSGSARQTVAPIGINDLRLIQVEFVGKPLRIAMKTKNPMIRDRIAVTNNRLEKKLIMINPLGEGCKELISDWQLGYYKEGTSDIDWGNALRGHACAGLDYSQEYHHGRMILYDSFTKKNG